MITLTLEADVLPMQPDAGGDIRIAGTRVTLDSILWMYKQGYAAEAIASAFPAVPLADVYRVISYYLRHQEAVDAYLEERQLEAEALRHEMERKYGQGPSRGDLLRRYEAVKRGKQDAPASNR